MTPVAIEREVVAIPQPTGGRIDVYSGVARLAGTLWAACWRDTSRTQDTAVLIVHPTSNFLGHYALRPLAELGVAAFGLTTRYLGNDSCLLMENCVLDIGAAVDYLRRAGYARVVLVGNSGGGGLAALYQSQAEHPTITATPAGDPPDLTATTLPPVDALVLAMAHPGRATVFTEWLDPAIVDERDPFTRDAALDMYDPNNAPPYDAEFLARYRSAQLERNRRITAWVRATLARLAERGAVDDLPFVVHGTAADPRFLDPAVDPSDRPRETLWGDPWRANHQPATLGHLTSLRSWLSQWSVEDSRANAYAELPHVSVPVQVVYGTADTAAFPSHAKKMYEAVRHDRRELVAIDGAGHYFRGQPELARRMCEHIVDWAARNGD
ncbi:MAG TPA: alpha/beta hydrolase [Actinoallomurus sp.]|nr:alpha/beta hydrolase [Actinoallomurus sp.]